MRLAQQLIRVGLVADVEGNLDYFCKYVKHSKVLRWISPSELTLTDESCYFVYGGDVIDKGPGDLRLCNMLVNLKRRHPDQVFLLVGNRDLNKLRLTSELSDAALALEPQEVPRPHWDVKCPTYAEFLEDEKFDNNRVSRLKWILKHTLGCEGSFEFRRQELSVLRNEAISDDDVVDSMIQQVLPGGALRDYMENAQVAVRLGSTLFVHGAVDALNAGYVPSVETHFFRGDRNDLAFPATRRFYKETNLDDWITNLNQFLIDGLKDHLDRPHFIDSTLQRRGGECLMALQNRCAVWGRSIISNCYADGGNPDSKAAKERRDKLWASIYNNENSDYESTIFEASSGYTSDALDPEVAAWLRKGGIHRVVVGHRPVGDSPSVLSSKYHGVEILTCDTSYSDVSALDNRGRALAAPLLLGPSLNELRTVLYGTLRDGRAYGGTFPLPPSCDENSSSSIDFNSSQQGSDDLLLGTHDADDWWYKATVNDGAAYLQCRGQGRRVEYREIPRIKR